MISPSDVLIERTDHGDYVCPVDGCYSSHWYATGLAKHVGRKHDATVPYYLVGEDAWREYLREQRLEHRRTPQDIATEFPPYIGRMTIEADLRRFGFYEPLLRTKPADYGPRRRSHNNISAGMPHE